MFPYVCLATMPIFCNADWPRRLVSYFKSSRITSFFIRNQGTKNCDKYSIASKTLDDILEEEGEFVTPSATPRKTKAEASNREETETSYAEVDNEVHDKTSVIKYQQDTVQTQHMKTVCRNIKKIDCKPRATKKQKFVVSLLLLYVALQFFLPYSHFITKVYYRLPYEDIHFSDLTLFFLLIEISFIFRVTIIGYQGFMATPGT